MQEPIRTGRISAINYENGTVRVLYRDNQEKTTAEIPLLANEYHMPEVDDLVLVVHQSNGEAFGVVLGRPWSQKNIPPEGFAGLYRKDFSRTHGKAMVRYDDNTGILQIHGDVRLQIDSGTVEISGEDGDVVIGGISLRNHTHIGDSGGITSQPIEG